MRPVKYISLGLPLELTFTHEIVLGFLDYARSQESWEVQCIDLVRILDGIGSGDWTDWDGLVLTGDVRQYKNVMGQRWKVVALHWIPDDPEIVQVDVDPYVAGSFAADYLMNTGSRRLAGISCISALNEHIARVEGFAARCRELDRSCKLFIRQGTWGKLTEEFVAELLDWLHSGDLPAALFCSDDISAARIIRELQTAGLHVPEDVAVLGCEDNQLICESSFPRLSSVHPPYRQVGFEAARKLDALFRGENLQQKSLWLPVDEISERMSTSLFAVDDIQLRRAFEYIRRHACEKISVNDVARHAGLTVTTLQRRFREKAGSSPNAEIQRARLDRVKEMLRAGSFTLDEIAEVTGYPSGPYLSKIFKRKTGQTVREYRVRCDPRRI